VGGYKPSVTLDWGAKATRSKVTGHSLVRSQTDLVSNHEPNTRLHHGPGSAAVLSNPFHAPAIRQHADRRIALEPRLQHPFRARQVLRMHNDGACSVILIEQPAVIALMTRAAAPFTPSLRPNFDPEPDLIERQLVRCQLENADSIQPSSVLGSRTSTIQIRRRSETTITSQLSTPNPPPGLEIVEQCQEISIEGDEID
jgi:hypothetical protein